MDQNSHLSSGARSSFIEVLREALLGVSESISVLEQAVLAERFEIKDGAPLEESEQEKARLYFYLYTVPLLESSGLLEAEKWEAALFWGSVQLCLGLHIRYADYIMDRDEVKLSLPRLTKQAHDYLARAQSLLWSRGYNWTPEQMAIYTQYIEYECEVEQGYFQDFGSLWRRVSPLCIAGETYLARAIRAPGFRLSYRNYLGWSLIHADCDDVLEDLAAQRKTPVTLLASERIVSHWSDLAGAAEVISHIKAFQAKQAQRLLKAVSDDYPAWKTIIRQMEKVFAY
jgi:hypothetical protein